MDYLVTDAELTSIADAIRTKTGSSSQIAFPAEFASEISALPVLDTSDATATAGDIATGKTAYVNGEKITGTQSSGTWASTTKYFPSANKTVAAGAHVSLGSIGTSNGIRDLKFSKDGSTVSSNISIYAQTPSAGTLNIYAYNSGTTSVTVAKDKVSAQYDLYTP